MRRLIIANTFYQVIFSMQMKSTVFKDDEVEIIVTDHSKSADVVSLSLKEERIFDAVYFVKTNGSNDNRSVCQRVYDIISISLFKTNRFSYYINRVTNLFFDELVVFNYDMRTYGIYAVLSSYNHSIRVSRFEEGILSYNSETIYTTVRTVIGFLRKVQGKAVIEQGLDKFYCFYPDLYEGVLKASAIPVITQKSCVRKALQNVFNVNNLNFVYKQKYIFFTSVYDFEGGKPVGEYELVCKVANLVGMDNLLIKTHPRDTRTIYVDSGFNVDKNSSIPWEVIQLTGDFSDKVFMTINSGSVLSGNTMSEKPVNTYYMYKLCDISGNESCMKNAHDIEKLLMDDKMSKILKSVKIAERIEDIL